MAYTSPHHGREFLKAAALGVCHHYQVRVQYRSTTDRRRIIMNETAEIDVCGRLAGYFGANAYLSAQGVTGADVIVDGPTLKAEVKFLRRNRTPWNEVMTDWNTLRDLDSVNEGFRKNGFLVFFPSKTYATSGKYITSFVSIPRSKLDGNREVYCTRDFAPLMPYMDAETTVGHVRQRLFINKSERTSIIYAGTNLGTRPVRADLVGKVTDPVWCILYTRITPSESKTLINEGVKTFQPSHDRILK
jgi:hypothetical protein